MSSDRVFREAAETSGKAHCNADVKQAGAYDPLNEGFTKRDMEVDINDQRYGWPDPPKSDWLKEALAKGKGKETVKRKRMEDFGLRHVRTWKERVMERLHEEGGEDAKHNAATWTMGDALAVALAELMDATAELGQVVEMLAVRGEVDHSAKVDDHVNTSDYLKQEILKFKQGLKAVRRW